MLPKAAGGNGGVPGPEKRERDQALQLHEHPQQQGGCAMFSNGDLRTERILRKLWWGSQESSPEGRWARVSLREARQPWAPVSQ